MMPSRYLEIARKVIRWDNVDQRGASLERDTPKRELMDSLESGMWIEWDSPPFGLLMGEVIEATPLAVTVWHPVAEKLITIPAVWVTRLLPTPMDDVDHTNMSDEGGTT